MNDIAAPSSSIAPSTPAAAAPSAPAASAAPSWMPAKFHTSGADGAFDMSASSQKLAESYASLTRRMGPNGIGGMKGLLPETPDGYLFEKWPEDAPPLDEWRADPKAAEFLKGAHALGFTEEQLEYAMGAYFGDAKQLVAGAKQLDANAAETALRQVWPDERAYDEGMSGAIKVATALAQKAGVSMQEVYGAFGNSPAIIRMLASVAREFGEGSLPAGIDSSGTVMTLEQMQLHPAAKDEKHPLHTQIRAAIRSHFERSAGR